MRRMLIIFFVQLLLVPAFVLHARLASHGQKLNGGLALTTTQFTPQKSINLQQLYQLQRFQAESTDNNLNVGSDSANNTANLVAASSDHSEGGNNGIAKVGGAAHAGERRQMHFQLQDNFSIWPCGDALDKNIAKLLFPAIMNYGLVPLVGAADTFWVGRMSNALALAGQGAANQLFNSVFWVFSFLPNVVTPLIAKASGADDEEALRERVAEAFYVAFITGVIGTLLLTFKASAMLSLVLKADAPARLYAEPYLFIRGLTVLPALLSSVGFAVFRGTLDVSTPLKISLLANLVNVVLDPLMIFPAKLGVVGAAVATCVSDLTSFAMYTHHLLRKKLLSGIKKGFPSFKALAPVLMGGASMQLRSVALNTAMIAVTRTAQRLDSTGGSVAAAHTISLQMFQLGSVAALAMGTVASIIIPLVLGKSKVQRTGHQSNDSISAVADAEADYRTLVIAKQSADRILLWGCILGGFLAASQYIAAGPLLKVFSPLASVQSLARGPSTIGAILQWLNCIVWTGEGLQQGHSEFLDLAFATILGTTGMMTFIKFFVNNPALVLTAEQSLSRVWLGFVVLSSVRLVATMTHHFVLGPLSLRRLKNHPGKHVYKAN